MKKLGKNDLIELAIQEGALKFGQFTLKSGRKSPYFFNIAAFCRGEAIRQLGRHCAQALLEQGAPFTMLFGPAYKGIPLAVATVIALATDYGQNIPYGFNRKEAKDHGEGGMLVGYPLSGQVAVLDDVVTAGTTAKEVLGYLTQAKARCAQWLVLLNRQEKNLDGISVEEWVHRQLGCPLVSVMTLQDIVDYLQPLSTYREVVKKIDHYRQAYGI